MNGAYIHIEPAVLYVKYACSEHNTSEFTEGVSALSLHLCFAFIMD